MQTDFNNENFRKLLLTYPIKAIELLYKRYYLSLLRVAFRYTRDDRDAEEVVEDSFVFLWENYKTFASSHDKPIEHFIVRVVKFKAITYYKKHIKLTARKRRFANGYDFKPLEYPIENKIIQEEIAERVRNIIETFPQKEKECLRLQYEQELTVAEIAKRLNVTIKAVERSLTSAKKRLRKFSI
ncbi:RNA polymerase sigma factor [Pseudochryseolinea flava]|uniref:RNA polymerase sigma-70 factor, ECF subfamily n=1 Tax=Pseudochryseolinea flava TaxID=2059302 RepID=A0A364Y6U5_9BACT|nr:sigma-70 family RNA polymerase sigma factor [Pseudochryseolinea flava]RAW01564.1 hypothetical protein DQQ10_07855 [Pseudochryseolinea flava]